MGWCRLDGAVGLSFSGVVLMGFLGTGGREAGEELGTTLPWTVGGVLLGPAVGRLGIYPVRGAGPAMQNRLLEQKSWPLWSRRAMPGIGLRSAFPVVRNTWRKRSKRLFQCLFVAPPQTVAKTGARELLAPVF